MLISRKNIILLLFIIVTISYIFTKDKENIFSLMMSSDLENIKKLINKTNVNEQDNYGKTAMHWAVILGDKNLEIVKYLISLNADLNIKDKEGKTPVFWLINSYIGHNNPKIEVLKIFS